jgi:hypothetical protein
MKMSLTTKTLSMALHSLYERLLREAVHVLYVRARHAHCMPVGNTTKTGPAAAQKQGLPRCSQVTCHPGPPTYQPFLEQLLPLCILGAHLKGAQQGVRVLGVWGVETGTETAV